MRTGQLEGGGPAPPHYYKISEYYAVILTNILASEKHPSYFGYGYVNGQGTIHSTTAGDPFWQSAIDQIINRRQGPPGRMSMRGQTNRGFSNLTDDQKRQLSRMFARDRRHHPKLVDLRVRSAGLFTALAQAQNTPFNPLRDLNQRP